MAPEPQPRYLLQVNEVRAESVSGQLGSNAIGWVNDPARPTRLLPTYTRHALGNIIDEFLRHSAIGETITLTVKRVPDSQSFVVFSEEERT